MNTPRKSKSGPASESEREQAVEVDETAVPPQTPKTDEELLDESLAETFPASDPISPGGSTTKAPERRPQKG